MGGTAVLVGASSGIGEALARRLHADGWNVHLLARREDQLHSIAASLGDRATAIPRADSAAYGVENPGFASPAIPRAGDAK